MLAIHKHIENAIRRLPPGDLIFASDFRGRGTEGAIKMALSRLARSKKIRRLAHGMYVKPKIDPLFGLVFPSPEAIAVSIAEKEKMRIKPAGAYALHRLGLTNQVPTNLVYLTDGSPRQIKVGTTIIKFKATRPKKMATIGKVSSLVIQALEELDITDIDGVTRERIKELLAKENSLKLKHDLKLATGRVNDYIVKLIKEVDNDRLASINGSPKTNKH